MIYIFWYNLLVRVEVKKGLVLISKEPKVSVTQENDKGRNVKFHNNETGRNMNREQFVKSIEKGGYPDYHVRKINGIKTPVSNPDSKKNNNLG